MSNEDEISFEIIDNRKSNDLIIHEQIESFAEIIFSILSKNDNVNKKLPDKAD